MERHPVLMDKSNKYGEKPIPQPVIYRFNVISIKILMVFSDKRKKKRILNLYRTTTDPT